jgi:AcrR family transcriptional regulator
MRVRLLLLKVTRELMHAKGLDGLTIADITEAADVARGSFYVHFASKDEVVEAVVLAGLRTLAEEVALDLTSDEDPAVRASDAARHVIRLTQDDPDLGSLLLQFNNAESLFTEAMTPFGRLLIERGQLSGRFAVSDLDVAVVSATAGAFAVIRAILRGELPPGSDRAHAEGVLRSLGVPFEEAHTISVRPLRRQKRSAKTPEGRLA